MSPLLFLESYCNSSAATPALVIHTRLVNCVDTVGGSDDGRGRAPHHRHSVSSGLIIFDDANDDDDDDYNNDPSDHCSRNYSRGTEINTSL